MPDLTLLSRSLEDSLPSLLFAYVFGSAAKGQLRAESDLDLAVYSQSLVDQVALFNVAADLSRLTGRDVDLVDLRAASTVFQSQIVTTGQVLLSRDEQARRYFEGRVYADYARLNEERHELLERIAREGRVHG